MLELVSLIPSQILVENVKTRMLFRVFEELISATDYQ